MMLGLTKREVAARFDEIVAFAELEEFIDAPVKTYSSGMYMRIGFAVAVHVDPEVLLVDEVLAVGDGRVYPQVPRQVLGIPAQGPNGAAGDAFT